MGKHGEEDAIANEVMGRRTMEIGTGAKLRRDRRKIEYAGGMERGELRYEMRWARN
jgi:hypothetical protein